MSKFWNSFDRICGLVSAASALGCLYYARVAYFETHGDRSADIGGILPYAPALVLGALAVVALIPAIARFDPGQKLSAEVSLQPSLSADAGFKSGNRDGKKQLVWELLSELGPEEISWLRRMVVSGRPNFIPEEVWHALERTGLVERDFSGPKGIKPEFLSLIEEWCYEHPLERRVT